MPVSLPVIYRRDLARLRALPVEQLQAAARYGTPIYGFIILDVQRGTLTVTRSGMTVVVEQDGRIVPAIRRKVG